MAANKLLTKLEQEAIRRMCATGMRDQQIADAIGRERSAVSRHRRKMGIARAISEATPPPTDFANHSGKTLIELARHYSRVTGKPIGVRTVRSWRKMLGIQPCKARQQRIHRSRVVVRPMSPTDALVAFLRSRLSNVHRCDIIVTERPRRTWGELRNMPDKGAGHWFLAGIGVVDRERMIKLADEMGFNPLLMQTEQARR
jgi:hypothetical protein